MRLGATRATKQTWRSCQLAHATSILTKKVSVNFSAKNIQSCAQCCAVLRCQHSGFVAVYPITKPERRSYKFEVKSQQPL